MLTNEIKRYIELSVIVVNYNTACELKSCLQSVILHNQNVSKEVLVIDNASGDNSIKVLSDFLPEIKLIKNNKNIGFSAAVNDGLRRVDSEYILLLNPDTILPPNCLRTQIDFLKANPSVGMLGPKLIRADGNVDHACRRNFPTKSDIIFHLFWLDRLFSCNSRLTHYSMGFKDFDIPGITECISGAFMLLRREAFRDVGYLDERSFMYGEDVDWAFRFRQAGWGIYYYPAVEVLHLKRASSKNRTPEVIRHFYTGNYLYYQKYYQKITHPLVNLFVQIAFIFRMHLSLILWKLIHKWV
jgi:GT2 family glycosyltransferase